jgi:hypothetical protein
MPFVLVFGDMTDSAEDAEQGEMVSSEIVALRTISP